MGSLIRREGYDFESFGDWAWVQWHPDIQEGFDWRIEFDTPTERWYIWSDVDGPRGGTPGIVMAVDGVFLPRNWEIL